LLREVITISIWIDYRDSAGDNYCNSGSLIHTSLDLQLYPVNQGSGTTKVGTGGCFSLGVSAVVEMNDNDYFKAYVEGKEKLWLDLIFVSESERHISQTTNLINGDVPLFGSFFLGVSLSFGVDLATEVDVDAGLAVVGGFNQKWSMKRGFKVKDGDVIKIADKDDHFEFHPLSIEGPVNIYGEISLQPYFGVSVDVLLMEAAEGAIKLEPHVYGEVDFQGEVYAGNDTLGDYTFETCYDAGYGIDWSYYIHGLFGAIDYNSPSYKIVGRKSFLRGGSKQCFPANANGVPTALSQDQLAQISDEFNNCLDWSEDWENSDSLQGLLICWLVGDNHYSFMRHLGPLYDDDPTKWSVGGEYNERYDAWDIGGIDVPPQDEFDWAMDWADLLTYGDAYYDWPEDSYAALYGAVDNAGLYEKHAPVESNGAIQQLIDTQCKEEDNKYIWTDFKSQLCTHNWDWYQEGYYGPDITLVTTIVEEVLGVEIYDPETDSWIVDEDAATESYEETRLVYAYDPDDPFHILLERNRWAPQYCFDWHKVAMQSTVPEDMEFFLKKCKQTLIDEPEANDDETAGKNRWALYEKVSEAFCEHQECPYSDSALERCPGDLLENDGTDQLVRRKANLEWNELTQSWDEGSRINMCLQTHVAEDPGNLNCGLTPADQAHCNDDCNTMPYCGVYDYGTVYCTMEYWEELRSQCEDEPKPHITEIKEVLLNQGLDNLKKINYAEWFEEDNIDQTKENMDKYLHGNKHSNLVLHKVETPQKVQTNFSFGNSAAEVNEINMQLD